LRASLPKYINSWNRLLLPIAPLDMRPRPLVAIYTPEREIARFFDTGECVAQKLLRGAQRKTGRLLYFAKIDWSGYRTAEEHPAAS
jgi:hypothetical protein